MHQLLLNVIRKANMRLHLTAKFVVKYNLI